MEAHKWRNLAVSRVTGDVQRRFLVSRNAAEKEMTPEQLAEAQKRAVEWEAAFEKRQAE